MDRAGEEKEGKLAAALEALPGNGERRRRAAE